MKKQAMRIGLARHFPVSVPWPSGWRTSAELQAWRAHYDIAEVNPFPVADEKKVSSLSLYACARSPGPSEMVAPPR